MADARQNWAGNQTYHATAVHRPESVEDVRELVARDGPVKVLGTQHSFNEIADTTGAHVSLEALDRIVGLDRKARTVTIEAGVRFGELAQFLHREGFALHNLASLPHIGVAGAVATATHGSGDRLGNIATAVTALEMVTGTGEVVALTREENPGEFPGVVVGLGALGIVTKLTLDIEPAYEVRQAVFEDLLFAEVETSFDAITSSATSVSLFTDWQAARFHQVWLKQRTDRESPGFTAAAEAAEFFGAKTAAANRHPLPDHDARNCTQQMGVAGPWHERLPHFRLEFTPSSGAELQSEFFVAREHAPAALRTLATMREAIAPLVFVTEVRTIAADDLWLSPCHGKARVGIHFTWKPDWPSVSRLLPEIEKTLAPFEPCPHWGKLFTMAPEQVRTRHPRMADFLRLRQRFDPEGKFRNAFLDACLGTGTKI